MQGVRKHKADTILKEKREEMVISNSRKLAALVLIVGLVSIVIGGLFIAQGFAKSSLITEAMRLEKVTYAGEDANGAIRGVIDTPQEAAVMAGVLRQHRLERYGYYSELKRDDPNRDTILKALTMENSLNLARLSYGLTDVVKATGAFMLIIGLTLTVTSASVLRGHRAPSR
jgi:hypothetical protein